MLMGTRADSLNASRKVRCADLSVHIPLELAVDDMMCGVCEESTIKVAV